MQRFLQLQIGGNMKNKGLDCLALTIAIIGAINWGLVGFADFDLVGALFGGMSSLVSRFIFALVGLAGLYVISFLFRRNSQTSWRADSLSN